MNDESLVKMLTKNIKYAFENFAKQEIGKSNKNLIKLYFKEKKIPEIIKNIMFSIQKNYNVENVNVIKKSSEIQENKYYNFYTLNIHAGLNSLRVLKNDFELIGVMYTLLSYTTYNSNYLYYSNGYSGKVVLKKKHIIQLLQVSSNKLNRYLVKMSEFIYEENFETKIKGLYVSPKLSYKTLTNKNIKSEVTNYVTIFNGQSLKINIDVIKLSCFHDENSSSYKSIGKKRLGVLIFLVLNMNFYNVLIEGENSIEVNNKAVELIISKYSALNNYSEILLYLIDKSYILVDGCKVIITPGFAMYSKMAKKRYFDLFKDNIYCQILKSKIKVG